MLMVMSENKYPLALQQIDRQFGTSTVQAYEHATQLAPGLGGLAVVAHEDTSRFIGSPLGLAGSRVELNGSRDHYLERQASGLAKTRLPEFSAFFKERDIIPRFKELVVTVLSHELGHANDLLGYIDRAHGDTAAAFRLSQEVRKSELATLPLQASTSRAMLGWDTNYDRYQDKLRTQGITDDKWKELLNQNTEAYRVLPTEQIADRFALGVLATLYS
jgi:hypothetical protein